MHSLAPSKNERAHHGFAHPCFCRCRCTPPRAPWQILGAGCPRGALPSEAGTWASLTGYKVMSPSLSGPQGEQPIRSKHGGGSQSYPRSALEAQQRCHQRSHRSHLLPHPCGQSCLAPCGRSARLRIATGRCRGRRGGGAGSQRRGAGRPRSSATALAVRAQPLKCVTLPVWGSCWCI